MKLRVLYETPLAKDLLDVDDHFDNIKDVKWDSGYTPLEILRFIIHGRVPDRAAYDIDAVQYFIRQFKLHKNKLEQFAIKVDRDMDIVDGYHQLTAAKAAGLNMFPYRSF